MLCTKRIGIGILYNHIRYRTWKNNHISSRQAVVVKVISDSEKKKKHSWILWQHTRKWVFPGHSKIKEIHVYGYMNLLVLIYIMSFICKIMISIQCRASPNLNQSRCLNEQHISLLIDDGYIGCNMVEHFTHKHTYIYIYMCVCLAWNFYGYAVFRWIQHPFCSGEKLNSSSPAGICILRQAEHT